MHTPRFSILSFLALILVPHFVLAQSAVSGEWVIQFKSENKTHVKALARKQNLKVRMINEKTALIQSSSMASVLKIDGVERVEPNYIYHITKTANDPFYSSLWGLKNTGQADTSSTLGTAGVDINVEKAWDLNTGSKKVVVAVIDTGVDFKIPDLQNNSWTNLAEVNGIVQVDDDKNGYIDDIHGFNFVSNTADATDDNGHGSHCSGTIGAHGNDGVGVAGINWDVSIMALKFISSDGTGTLENAVKAIDYARKNGAQVMSNSWGGSSDSAILKQAVSDANDAGILFVAAAGNNGSDNDKTAFYPSSYEYDNVISVAAINNRARLSSFSNFGLTKVDIAAPGENILSTTPQGLQTMSGTSMATPHVAGVAALLLANEPTLTYQEVKDRILTNARPLFRLKNRIASGGMIDAFAVLSNTKPDPDMSDPTLLSSHQSSQVSSLHPYANETDQMLTIKVPGAQKIAIHFSRFEIETNFDFVEILDGAGKSHDKLSGYHSDEYSEIIDGDTIILHFTSDKTINAYGFDVDQVFFQ